MKRIEFKTTDQNYAQIRANAKAKNVSISAYIRYASSIPYEYLPKPTQPSPDRSVNSAFQKFLATRCKMIPFARMSASEAFAAYQEQCEEMGLRVPGRCTEFVRQMRTVPGVSNIKPQNRSFFTGIELIPSRPGKGGS